MVLHDRIWYMLHMNWLLCSEIIHSYFLAIKILAESLVKVLINEYGNEIMKYKVYRWDKNNQENKFW